jgi:DNA-binding SARP family transcriptional activator/Flp pilus assembly protein TadD
MIRLRTLGALDLRGSGGEELRAVLAQPRRAALLAYLALATPRGVQRRDTILALFWPELDIDRSRNALGQALHFLRKSVGETSIESRNGEGLALDWSNFWCDAAAFEDALDANRIDEALALYRGDLMQGFHIDDAPEFERWLDSMRVRLATRYTKAVETLAAEREAADDFHGAATHWRVLALRDPYNSRLTLRLMRALKASGDPAGALLQGREHERLLRDELGIAADNEVTRLVQQLQSGASDHPVRPLAHAAAKVTFEAPWPEGRRVVEGDDPAPRPARSRRAPALAAALVIIGVGIVSTLVFSDRGESRSTASQVRELYDRGRRATVSRNGIGVETGAAYYRRAIEQDSTFALAYAGLSEAHIHMAFYGFAAKREALDTARMLAQRAVELDSTLPETRTALAYSLANSGHLDLADREFREALRLGPTNSTAHYYYGMLLAARGDGKKALAQAESALLLDPAAPRGVVGLKQQSQYLITLKRSPPQRPILKIEVGEPWARAQQAVDLADEGRCKEAQADIALAQQLVPETSIPMLAFAGTVAWSCGEKAKARAILARMTARPDAGDYGFRIALLLGHMGEMNSAFAWLDRNRWMLAELMMLSSAVRVDPLRSDERLLQRQRSLGIRK